MTGWQLSWVLATLTLVGCEAKAESKNVGQPKTKVSKIGYKPKLYDVLGPATNAMIDAVGSGSKKKYLQMFSPVILKGALQPGERPVKLSLDEFMSTLKGCTVTGAFEPGAALHGKVIPEGYVAWACQGRESNELKCDDLGYEAIIFAAPSGSRSWYSVLRSRDANANERCGVQLPAGPRHL